MRRAAMFALLSSISLLACDLGSEAAFVRGRAQDPCIQSIPACPGIFAACRLSNRNYARFRFPGVASFIVEADPEGVIDVQMHLAEQQDSGLETQILWYEPGCTEVYTYDSGGVDLFEEANDVGYLTRHKKVFVGGEHLVEIISDMQAIVVVAIDVQEAER